MSLILPPAMQAKYRPLSGYATVELMQELHERGLLHELSGSIAMPEMPLGSDFSGNQMRHIQLASLLHKMALALGQSGLILLGSEKPIGGISEILHAKIVVCRHPQLDPQNQEMRWKQGPPAEQLELPLMDPPLKSETSSHSAAGQPQGLGNGAVAYLQQLAEDTGSSPTKTDKK